MSLRDDMLYLSGRKTRKENIWKGKEPYEIDENSEEVVREIKTESDLLKSFNDLTETITRLRYQLDRSYGPYEENPEKKLAKLIQAKKDVTLTKEKLYSIAMDKMEKIKEVIEDVLGSGSGKEKSNEEDEEEDFG